MNEVAEPVAMPRDGIDVVVVGAGPTGLMLAGDLAEAGVRVAVLERRAGESNVTRAFAVHARTMEELQIRGVADRAGRDRDDDPRTAAVRPGGDRPAPRLPSRFPSLLITPQFRTEQVLTRRLDRLGVSITHGCRGDRRDPGRRGRGRAACAPRTVPSGATGRPTWSARTGCAARCAPRWACRTRVAPWSRSLMLADVRLTDPPEDVLAVNGVGDAFAFVAPFGDGWYRVFAWNRRHQVDDSAPVELSEVREVTRRALGTDFGMHDPRFLSRFHSDERQVPTLPGRAGVPGRRRGALPLPGRRAGHEHRHPGRGEPRLEAGRRGGTAGAASSCWTPTTPSGTRWAPGAAQQRAAGAAGPDPAPVGPGGPQRVVPRAAARSRRSRTGSPTTISAIGVRYPAPPGADRRVGTRAPDVALARRTHGSTRRCAAAGSCCSASAAAELELPPQVDAAVPAQPGRAPTGWSWSGRTATSSWAGTAAEFPAWASDYFRRRTQPVNR